MNQIVNKKIEFQKYKNEILKKYPTAKTIFYNKVYFIINGDGTKIIPDEYLMMPALTIFDAWRQTSIMLNHIQQLKKGNLKFKDDVWYNSQLKKKQEILDEYNHLDKF